MIRLSGQKLKLIYKFFATILIVICLFLCGGCLGNNAQIDSSSSGSGSTTPSESKIGNPICDGADADDYYLGCLLLTDATALGKYYDNVTESVVSFSDLIDREIETFLKQLVYSLNIIYGNNSTFPSNSSTDSYSLSSAWANNSNLIVFAQTLLDNSHSCGNIGGTYTFNCEACQSRLAGLNGQEIEDNPLNYENAILGGYSYDSATKLFTSNLNTTRQWLYRGGTEDIDSLKIAIAKILCVGDYNANITYDYCLENIDHLGYTDYELELLKTYVLDEIIGEANVAYDNSLSAMIGPSITITSGDSNTGNFLTNNTLHDYKSYTYVVDKLVSRMVELGTGGSYPLSNGQYPQVGVVDVYSVYPNLARINIEFKKFSEISSAVNGISEADVANMSEEELNEWYRNMESNNSNPEPCFTPQSKLLSIIFLPKVSNSLAEDFKDSLAEKYGQTFASGYDCNKFTIGSLSIGIGDGASSDYVNQYNEFLINLSFLVKIDGEKIIDGYIDNYSYSSASQYPNNEDARKILDYFPNEKDIIITNDEDLSYDSSKSVAGYDISNYIKNANYGTNKKISEYDGVDIVDDDGNLNSKYFKEVSGEKYLNVWNNLFTTSAKYSGVGSYVSGINAEFLGGDNFWQINFEYFVNTNGTKQSISSQFIYLMYLYVWTD